MSRRYSFLPLRPADLRSSWTGNSSKSSSTSANGGNSPGMFFYPPLQPTPENDISMASPPPPHPYQLAGISTVDRDTPAGTSNISHEPRGSRSQHVSELGSEKPEDVLERSAFPTTPPPGARSRARTPSFRAPLLLRRMRPLFLVLIFLPLPPLLALVYLLTGHTILRHVHPFPDPAWQTSLMSSAAAAATGGIVLAVPLALLLYALVYPRKPPAAPEDFFEDDESLLINSAGVRYVGYGTCVLLAMCVGGVAGPLGVACVGGPGKAATLSAGRAAEAGLVGGALLCGGVVVLMSGVLGVWALWPRNEEEQQ